MQQQQQNVQQNRAQVRKNVTPPPMTNPPPKPVPNNVQTQIWPSNKLPKIFSMILFRHFIFITIFNLNFRIYNKFIRDI